MTRIASLIITIALSILAPVGLGAFTVVIDPGHGGREVGCVGKNTYEKDVTLAVAQQFGELIKKKYKNDVKVIYTRTSDTQVSLGERAEKANCNDADLFISIHVNSIEIKSKGRENVHGAQVYTCNLDKDPQNAAIINSGCQITQYDKKGNKKKVGRDSASSESCIAFEMIKYRRDKASHDMAKYALKKLVSTARRANKGSLQANYQVLWNTKMPAVLVELDYMCNPEMEKYLKSKKGQSECAQALFEAFNEYYKLYN